jgi:DNA-binding PadR family transcriptional regulator
MEKMIQELCLLLMFLTGWEEESRQKPGEKIFRAWKGYLFEVLNKLADEKMIVQFANTKSVTLTEAGKQRARQLKEQFFSEKGANHGKW